MAENKLMQFPYEKVAMAGGEMPDGLAMPDCLMFLGLRFLYSQYKSGTIGRETATAEKRKLISKYKYQMFLQEASERYVKQIHQTEDARAEYRKDRTLEAADRLVMALEGKSVCQ